MLILVSLQHLRPQSSLAGDLADGGGRRGGSRFLKKKAVPNEALSGKSSQLEQQQPAPHLRGSQTAALNRLADLESRVRSRKQARPVLKPASGPRPSPGPAASPPPPSSAGAAQPFGLSPSSSDERSPKGKRFLKPSRSSGVKTSLPAGPGVGMGPRTGDADGAEPSAGTEMRRTAGVSLESDEEDMKVLLGDSLDSLNSHLTPARPAFHKTAEKVLCTAKVLFARRSLQSFTRLQKS